MVTIYIPITDTFRGTSATGSDGDSNRTITLSQVTTSVVNGMNVVVDGTSLNYTADFTFANGVITFLNALWDTSYINIRYFYTTTTSSLSGQYCTTKQVFEYLDMDESIPDYNGGTTTPEEVIAASASSTATVYTDKTRIIDDTYTFTYGSSSTATQTSLTETTHYSLNKDIGAFTLTAAGNTLVGSNGVYAKYKYNLNFTDSKVSDIIDRKTKFIDQVTEQSWQTTSLNSKEEYAGRGAYDRIYRLDNQPTLFATTQLNGAVAAGDSSITVDDTTGFTANDYITINSEVLLISSVTDSTTLAVTRAQYGTTAAAHSDNDRLVNVVVEVSNAPVGFSPTFQILSFDNEFDVDSNIGAVQVLHINPKSESDIVNGYGYPEHHLFNRIRITYRSGATSVPNDINNACILMTCKELYGSQKLNALSRGTNGFTGDLDDIQKEIDKIISENKLLLSSRG